MGPHNNFFTLTSEVGSVINVTDRSVLKLSGETYVEASSSETDWLWKAEFAFNPIRNFDFRLGIESNGHQEAILASMGYYFD